MSTQTQYGTANAEQSQGQEPIDVSLHAVLRYMERVDATEAFPGARIREIYEHGEEYRCKRRGISTARRLGDVVVGYNERAGVIMTVMVVGGGE